MTDPIQTTATLSDAPRDGTAIEVLSDGRYWLAWWDVIFGGWTDGERSFHPESWRTCK
jgi:hypothetical protein